MCPQCGNKESALQSVVDDQWECRLELGGCGAAFELTSRDAAPEQQDAVGDAVRAMSAAILKFEHQECPLGQPSLLEIQQRTAALLDILKSEIKRLVTVFDDDN